MKTTKLTTFAKLIIFVIVAAAILVPCYLLGLFDGVGNKADVQHPTATTANAAANDPVANTPVDNGNDVVATPADNTPASPDVLKISLDEWIGWKSIIDANGGLKTAAGSIYDQLGLNLEISIINDATQSSNAVINKSLDGAGYTVNRYAFLYPKFAANDANVKMVYITNYSYGGDGIISKSTINGVEGLVGKTIGVPRFSEAQTLVEWLVSKSSLTNDQISKINMVMFDTPDDAAKAFFAGQLDAAATWQPYLSQAQSTSGAKLLFSTKSATNLILDGIVFRDDVIAAKGDMIAKFVEGALKAIPLYTTEFSPIKDSMPLFATEEDDSIKAMTGDAALTDYSANMNLFKGTAQTLFVDMSNIWKRLGEEAAPEAVNDAFDSAILMNLSGKFEVKKVEAPKFTQAQREEAKKQDNSQALLTQKLTINFETASATITEDSYAAMKSFADTAKLLNGVIIQIEGNTDSTGDPIKNKTLSQQRAKAVATYLQFQDVDPTRFVIIGNGQDKPVADNKTEAGKASNRRTDVFFKVVN